MKATVCGAGPVILFVHGLMGSAGVWDSVVSKLPEGYRAVAVDLPGFGESPPFSSDKQTIHDYGILLRNLTEELSEKQPLALIVADSFGARVVLDMLKGDTLRADSIVLSGCFIEGVPKMFSFLKRKRLVSNLLKFARLVPASFIVATLKVIPISQLRHLRKIDSQVVNLALRSDPETVESLLRELFCPFMLSSIKANLNNQIVLIRGELDNIVSEGSAKQLGKVLGAQVIGLPKVGHTSMLEDPQAYAEALCQLLPDVG